MSKNMSKLTLEKEKKYINVALVGHVANGKTTLVKQLTGVCTKRDSSEKKTGRTVKLGYANCLVWKCPICEVVFTTGQEEQKSCCSFELEPIQYISFVDAPGHHSFIHTMIKGAAIVDCAILVTDVRKDCLQVQTIEHLAILDVLGVKNILVVQNKIDLSSDEQCRIHYEMLQRELKDTVAEGAPIIPISAQSGQGMNHMRNYLYKMSEYALKNVQPFDRNVFSVVRSFDINLPNTPQDQLKGGVLGGTVRGELGYKVGDKLEIRPGIIRSITEWKSLETTIESIFSETRECSDMARGGLYGVGTTLDPTLTRRDSLVGCLVGSPTELPDVITEIVMKVVRVKLSKDDTPKVTKGEQYRLIIGNNVVGAIASSKTKDEKDITYWKMKLSQPICTIDKRCLIYSGKGKVFQLIAFGMFGDQSYFERNVQTLPQSMEEYLQLLPKSETKTKEKVTIPVPSLFARNRDVIWGNVNMFCEIIHREPVQICTYIKQELCMEASICQDGLRLIKSRLNSNKLQTVLRKYIVDFVACDQCKGINTLSMRDQSARAQVITCQSCGSTRILV